MVITSYNTVASEYAAYTPTSKDESKSKKSKKDDSGSAEDSDDSIDEIRKHLQKNKSKPATRATKTKDALFRLKYWRIVLGKLPRKLTRICIHIDGCRRGAQHQEQKYEDRRGLLRFTREV